MIKDETYYRSVREKMIESQIKARGIKDDFVIRAMAELPREAFVPESEKATAYTDSPLPIGEGQTISQPYIVARMLELLKCAPGLTVLDVGSGSGYQAALLAKLSKHVYAVERIPVLAGRSKLLLNEFSIDNVTVITADGSQGLPEHAPFDRIICGAAGPAIPEPWKRQLAENGKIVAPVGDRFSQRLVSVTRNGDQFMTLKHDMVRFVPLLGEHGFGRE